MGGGGVDREQIARHIHHAAQLAIAWHVDAVVVAGAQIQRGEVAVLELGCQAGVTAHQGGAAVSVAFGLEDLVLLDAAELADASIDRAHPSGLRHGPCAGFQGACEEVVEAGVVRGVRVQRFVHVHAITADEPLDQTLGTRTAAFVGDEASETCQAVLRGQVLGQHTPTCGGISGRDEVEIWRRRRQSAAQYHGTQEQSGCNCIERVFAPDEGMTPSSAALARHLTEIQRPASRKR